jgi:hypothetical protein
MGETTRTLSNEAAGVGLYAVDNTQTFRQYLQQNDENNSDSLDHQAPLPSQQQQASYPLISVSQEDETQSQRNYEFLLNDDYQRTFSG